MSFLRSEVKSDRLIVGVTLILVMCMVAVTSYVYARETSAFRFFDEENNIVAGYLMHQGRDLYREIFMNHNPLPIFISKAIQDTFPIHTLFELIKYHRIFMIVFAFIFNALLVVRFRARALLFIFVYEFIKFYLSGQMFLAEGLIAYPIAYIVMLLSQSVIRKVKIQSYDVVICSCLCVGILLSREPYIPVTLLLYGIVLLRSASKRIAFWCATASAISIVVYMVQFDLSEYIRQVVRLNQSLAQGDLKAQSNLQAFSGILQLYQYLRVGVNFDKPLYMVLSVIVLLLIPSVYKLTQQYRNTIKLVGLGVFFVILFLAGIRNYGAGSEWYGMYRSIPYIAILLSFVSSALSPRVSFGTVLIVLAIAILHPRSHLREPRDNAREYYINYSQSNQVGQVLQLLCRNYGSKCLLHIDDIDVYPYWVSGLPPVYRYVFHYPVNKAYLDYRDIRDHELTRRAPLVYYDGSCLVDPTPLPTSISSSYIFLRKFSDDKDTDKQSCIAIHTTLIPYIDDEIISSIARHGYRLPVSLRDD